MSEPAPPIPLHPKPGYRATASGSGSTLPDPIGELRFLVEIKGIQNLKLGAFSDCTGLSAEWDVFEYQEGGRNEFVHKFRNRLKFPNLVLKRGVTYENGLLEWFFRDQDRDKRDSVLVTLLGHDGRPVRSWEFARAFPLKWQGPAMNAKSTNVAIETLEIGHEGLKDRT